MIDIFADFYTKKEINHFIETGVIEIIPLMFMRGRTFKNTYIIADEVQNTIPSQLLMLLTRCGENSKIILTGDPNQSDLKVKNGLVDFIEKYTTNLVESTGFLKSIKYIELENKDIQRSELVKQVLHLYGEKPKISASTSTIKQPSLNTLPPPPMLFENTKSNNLKQNIEIIKKTNTKMYMERINNAISKIPEEYGDYVYITKETPANPTTGISQYPTTISTIIKKKAPDNNDSAMIPKSSDSPRYL
jgi:hypothetical protein